MVEKFSQRTENLNKRSLPKATLGEVLEGFDRENANYSDLAEKIKNKIEELSKNKENRETFKLEIKKIKDENGKEIDHPVKYETENDVKVPNSYIEILEGFWTELEPKLDYLEEDRDKVEAGKSNKDRVKFAFWMACYIHAGDRRKTTGVPYMIHIKEVVEGALDMKLDADSVISAMLHDTSEDHSGEGYADKGEYPGYNVETEDFITKHFGPKVGYMVALLNKNNYGGGEYHKHFEKLVKNQNIDDIDIKVVLLKITDYLKNISSPNNTEPEQEKKMIEKGVVLYKLAKELRIFSVISRIEFLILEQYFGETEKGKKILEEKKTVDESLKFFTNNLSDLGLEEGDLYINYNLPTDLEIVKKPWFGKNKSQKFSLSGKEDSEDPEKYKKFEGLFFRIKSNFLQEFMNRKPPQVFVRRSEEFIDEKSEQAVLRSFQNQSWEVVGEKSRKSGIKGNLNYEGDKKTSKIITLEKMGQKIELHLVSPADFEWQKFGKVSFLGEVNNKFKDYEGVPKGVGKWVADFFRKKLFQFFSNNGKINFTSS
jgi:hypothetical protein